MRRKFMVLLQGHSKEFKYIKIFGQFLIKVRFIDHTLFQIEWHKYILFNFTKICEEYAFNGHSFLEGDTNE